MSPPTTRRTGIETSTCVEHDLIWITPVHKILEESINQHSQIRHQKRTNPIRILFCEQITELSKISFWPTIWPEWQPFDSMTSATNLYLDASMAFWNSFWNLGFFSIIDQSWSSWFSLLRIIFVSWLWSMLPPCVCSFNISKLFRLQVSSAEKALFLDTIKRLQESIQIIRKRHNPFACQTYLTPLQNMLNILYFVAELLTMGVY